MMHKRMASLLNGRTGLISPAVVLRRGDNRAVGVAMATRLMEYRVRLNEAQKGGKSSPHAHSGRVDELCQGFGEGNDDPVVSGFEPLLEGVPL